LRVYPEDETEHQMKPLALFAAAGALIALAACSSQAHPTAAPAHRVVDNHPAVLVNCPQRYDTWRQGPARKVVGALNAVVSANAAGSMATLKTALNQAAPSVAKAGRYPIPACADPKGYWVSLLMHVNAAVGTKASPSQASSITLAMKGVTKLNRQLQAELKNTAGVK
jgi:hypothetical protein